MVDERLERAGLGWYIRPRGPYIYTLTPIDLQSLSMIAALIHEASVARSPGLPLAVYSSRDVLTDQVWFHVTQVAGRLYSHHHVSAQVGHLRVRESDEGASDDDDDERRAKQRSKGGPLSVPRPITHGYICFARSSLAVLRLPLTRQSLVKPFPKYRHRFCKSTNKTWPRMGRFLGA